MGVAESPVLTDNDSENTEFGSQLVDERDLERALESIERRLNAVARAYSVYRKSADGQATVQVIDRAAVHAVERAAQADIGTNAEAEAEAEAEAGTETETEITDLAPVFDDEETEEREEGQPPLQPGDSVFEAVLEQIVQGLHGFLPAQIGSARLDAILASAPDIVCALDANARFVTLNDAFARHLGYTPESLVGQPVSSILVDGTARRIERRARAAAQREGEQIARPNDILMLRFRAGNGAHLSLECVTVAAEREGTPLLIAAMRDPSLHRSLMRELRLSKDNYDALSETLTEAIVRINEDFEIVFANGAVLNTFGYQPQELIGKAFATLFPQEVYRRHEKQLRTYFLVDDTDRGKMGLSNTLELLGRHKHRGVAPMEISFGNSKEYRGRTLTCIIRDITQRKSAERRLRQLAYHDQLTGLGNRDLFDDDIRKLLETPELFETAMAALLFLDLDGFKQVNDTMGHDAGDQLLIDTGVRLRRCLRETDSVYRFGGDEFVVLLSRVLSRRDAALVANNILGEIRRPFDLPVSGEACESCFRTASVGVSIGIAMIPPDGQTIADVTRAADLAMYSAKEAGKNRFEFYRGKLTERARERWELEQGMRSSLAQGDFELHYQPIVEADGVVRGLEALLRWHHPQLGNVSPGKFIPVAEETGLIVPLGNWVLETALRDLRAWNESGHPDLYMAINLSPRQFDQVDLVDSIGGALVRSGVSPSNVKLEITESCIMSAPRQAIEKMRELKERYPGLTISIDDFGTGYSSLSYLSQLPTDTIKIDLTFVSNLFAVQNQKVVNAIINLAHSMDLDIVAEGVESREQWEYFNRHQCRSLQGYYFGRAVSREQVQGLLEHKTLPYA